MGRLVADVATALSRGTREIQQDSLVTDFPVGFDFGYMVLADGMGGHTAGEIASNIVVTEMFAELKFRACELKLDKSKIPSVLVSALESANECIREYVAQYPDTYGMGSTVIAPVIAEDCLYWVSVGDSPLFLFRDGELRQLNENHSLVPDIELMVRTGMLTEEQGRTHPDRSCLKSVIIGSEISKIDCPDVPVRLKDGDIVVASSDGFLTLSQDAVRDILEENCGASGHQIVQRLHAAIEAADSFDQDNVSISVIKLSDRKTSTSSVLHARPFENVLEPETTSAVMRVSGTVT